MTDDADLRTLDTLPTADTIRTLRKQARERGESVGAKFPAADDTLKRFVVSPRGTCVVLNDTREESFIPSVSAEEIASTLQK